MIDVPVEYRPNRALHPGKLLAEELAARDMTQREFAERMNRPTQVVNQIIRGKKAVTPETALEMEKVLGVDAQIWLNLQRIYDLVIARMAEDERLEQEAEWLQRFPVAAMVRLGWIEEQSRKSERLRELLKFFAIPSFQALEHTALAIGFRISEKAKVDEWALRAWMRQGDRLARSHSTDPYDAKRFRASVQEIRSLTSETPEVFWPRMQHLCASAGVSVVAVPHLPKTGANGVARWLNPRKAMIQLNLRYAWADIFWFTFFHEAAHVLEHKTKRVFVDLEGDDRSDDSEVEANEFALATLISPEKWEEFVDRGRFTGHSVQALADEADVDPGIIVGRLQHEGRIPFNRLNNLRTRLRFVAAASPD